MSATAQVGRRKSPWLIAWIAGMASYVDAAAIVSTGIALVLYQNALGITGGEFGVLSGSLTFAIAVGALVGGRLGDTFGRRRVFIATMVVIVAGAALLYAGTSFPALLAGVLLVGIGTGADLPVSLATISEAGTDKNRGALIGLSAVLWSVGYLAAIAVSAVVGDWGRTGGQVMFAHIGVVALLVLLARLTVPESESWLRAREEGRTGATTTRAQRVRLSDLARTPYTRPFLALMLFYALTNLAANTTGQYGTYVAVNLAGIPVELNSRIGLLLAPLAFVAAFWFMRIVDTRWRMLHFVIGGVLLVAAYATPAVFGFSLPTIVAVNVLSGVGNAFAFEGIMKVWTQESFPTMLRSTAQGTIVAVARVSAAVLATLTPAVFDASPRGMYGGLAVVVLIGLAIAWSAFHGTRGRNEFLVEEHETSADDAPAPAAPTVAA